METADQMAQRADEELNMLRLLVETTERSVITFALFRSVAEREAGVQYLKERLAIPVVECALSAKRTDPVRVLAEVQDERACVQIYDLEAALPDVTQYMNLKREEYAAFPHALVFWVGAHGLQEVARKAPDFWAWRSGVFDVRTEQPGIHQAVTQQALAQDIRYTDRGDLERRASLYEGLIREYEAAENVEDAQIMRLRGRLASLYHLLRDLDGSERQAEMVRIYAEETDNDFLAAMAYHQLGAIAQERRDFGTAEQWYKKSLSISEAQNNERGAASTYHNMGVMSQALRDLDTAQKWYEKALEISNRYGNLRGEANAYHSLGVLAEAQQDYDQAEIWYQKSLEVKERQSDEWGLAKTYHQLGVLAQERRDYEASESWYERALEINKRQGNAHGAAITYAQIGIFMAQQGKYLRSGQHLIQALFLFLETNNKHSAQRVANDFCVIVESAPADQKEKLWSMWTEAGCPFPKV